jgi:hypothetical protein
MYLFEIVIFIMVTILLPIIPAYILYKALPIGKAIVTGPFKGLNIQLTGAFAGYFLVVLVVFGFIELRIREKCQIWHVTGHIELENNPSPTEIEHILVSIRPPLWKVNPDGKFSVDILVKPGATGELDWPLLSFDHPSDEYEMIPIDTSTKEYPFGLPPYKKKLHKFLREVVITDPLILKKKQVQ